MPLVTPAELAAEYAVNAKMHGIRAFQLAKTTNAPWSEIEAEMEKARQNWSDAAKHYAEAGMDKEAAVAAARAQRC